MTLLDKLKELLDKGTTPEEIQSSLAPFMIPKGEFNKVNDANKLLTSKVDDLELQLGGANQELEDIKVSNLDEAGKMQHELDKARETIKSHAIEKNKLTEANKFAELGYSKEQYQPILDNIITDDATHSANVSDSFLNLLKTQTEKAKEDVVDKLLGDNLDTPKGDDLPDPKSGIDSLVDDFNSDL